VTHARSIVNNPHSTGTFAYLTHDEWVALNTPEGLDEQVKQLISSDLGYAIYQERLHGQDSASSHWNDHIKFLMLRGVSDERAYQAVSEMHYQADYLVDQEERLWAKADTRWGLQPLGYSRWRDINYRFGHIEGWIHADAPDLEGFGQPALVENWSPDRSELALSIVGSRSPRQTPLWVSAFTPKTNIAAILGEAEALSRDVDAIAVLQALTVNAITF